MRENKIIFVSNHLYHKNTGGTIYNKKLIAFLKKNNYNITIKIIKCLSDITFSKEKIYILDGIVCQNIAELKLLIDFKIIIILHILPQFNEDNFENNSKISYSLLTTFILSQFRVIVPHAALNKIQAQNVMVINPGINQDLKIKSTYKKHPQKIIYIANFIPLKNQLFLIDVMADLKDLNLQIDCYGEILDTNYFNQFQDSLQKNKLNNITYKGVISHNTLLKKLIHYDLSCIFSKFETGPLAIIESIHCKVPILMTPVGNAPTLLKHQLQGILPDFNKETCGNYIRKLATCPLFYLQHIQSLNNYTVSTWENNFEPLKNWL